MPLSDGFVIQPTIVQRRRHYNVQHVEKQPAASVRLLFGEGATSLKAVGKSLSRE
jgi:hypothetical protein